MIKDKMLNDLAELAGGAMGVWSALRQQMRDEVRDRVDQMSGRLDLATRADIDRLEGMMAKLRARIDTLEGKGPKSPAAKSKASPRRAVKPKTSAKTKSSRTRS